MYDKVTKSWKQIRKAFTMKDDGFTADKVKDHMPQENPEAWASDAVKKIKPMVFKAASKGNSGVHISFNMLGIEDIGVGSLPIQLLRDDLKNRGFTVKLVKNPPHFHTPIIDISWCMKNDS